MCESKLYLREGESLRHLMSDVIKMYLENESITAVDIAGNKLELKGYRVVEVDTLRHKIIIESVR